VTRVEPRQDRDHRGHLRHETAALIVQDPPADAAFVGIRADGELVDVAVRHIFADLVRPVHVLQFTLDQIGTQFVAPVDKVRIGDDAADAEHRPSGDRGHQDQDRSEAPDHSSRNSHVAHRADSLAADTPR
jgi:hypothetical protein